MNSVKNKSSKQRRGALSCILQIALWALLPLLVTLYILYAVETQSGIVYRAISETPIERQVLRVLPMIWRHKTFLERQSMNIDLSTRERAASKQLFLRMERLRPTHCFKLKGGEFLFGRPAGKTNDGYVVSYFDQNRRQERVVPSADIVSMTPLVMGQREFTPKNIRFLLNFTNLQHYYLEPYLIVTDVPFASAMELYGILAIFEEQYRSHFGPLINQDNSGIVQVAYFSSRAALVRNLSETVPNIPNASAFFNKSTNSLYLYAQQETGNPGSPHMFKSVLLDSATDKKERKLALFRVIRHEGAHHFTSAMGVLEGWDPVPFWIEEGVAQYCEVASFGQLHPEKLEFLRHAQREGRLLPWDILLAASQESVSLLSEKQAQLYYAQSWILFHYLMDKQRRPLFMSFILKTRDHGNWQPSDSLELANTLRTTWSRIDSELIQLLTSNVHKKKYKPSG